MNLKNKSIYDDGRMAQPDEVWNFGRGDGAEKAFLMADALIHNDPAAGISVSLDRWLMPLLELLRQRLISFVTTTRPQRGSSSRIIQR
ncbi:MAG: hypothetical protein MZV63_23410 [Marinilabiliales bacterium]|nr:hypothetical protein [Marinilabiliales bacterium]